jgi:hypothetical protein
MRQITFPSKEIIPKKDINKLIKVKTKKNPFRSEKESEEFYKNIIEEEMILSNDYNFANIEKLLNLYIKGINLHQKTLDTKEIYYFQEKINLLLNTPKVKSIINKEKKKTDLNIYFDDNNNNSFKIEKRPKNNNDINLLRSKTYKNNIALNSFKLKALNQSIKQELEAKEYQKKKIDKINKELFNKNKSVLLLKDDFKNQANNFKEKLLLKRKNKLNMSTINKDKENNINNKNKSLTAVYSLNKKIEVKEEINLKNNDDNNIIKESLKEKIYKYFDEYNDNIYKYYYLKTLKKISELAKENISKNMKINEEYQTEIKNLLKMQLEENSVIDDEDINNYKEELENEIQKNDDLFEKDIEEEISIFKLNGYSFSAPKELEMLKNKIKCEIYNNIYNILNK